MKVINTTFDQNPKSDEPLILVTSANFIGFDNVSVSACPLGHAIRRTFYKYNIIDNRHRVGFSFSCKECDYNFYSLQRGTAKGSKVKDGFQCLPCPRGADCFPAIESRTNYWGYRTSSNPPKLAFIVCPFGYCKSPPSNSLEYNACQGKRAGVMCGVCFRGLYRSSVVNLLYTYQGL